jgi:type IV pilus assembly protein PilQ
MKIKKIIFILFIGMLALPAYAAALTIKSVDFMNIDNKSRVTIGLDDKATYDVVRKDNTVILKIEDAKIPESLVRPFITRDFVTAVDRILPKQVGKDVLIEISMKQMAPYFISQDKNLLLMDFDIPAEIKALEKKEGEKAKIIVAQKKTVVEKPAQEASMAPIEPISSKASVMTPTIVSSLLPKYKGQPITLDFQNADIHNVLRIIADVSGLNIVTSDDVKGTITIRLKDVPWDQALDVILESKDLAKMEIGNVVRIAPAKIIDEARKRMIDAQKSQEQLEPLVTSVIPLSFASTKSILESLEKNRDKEKGLGVLSERASVIGDERTNTLFVKDIRKNVDDFYAMIKRLDRPTPQVLIAARVVQADTNFSRGLGVQWGGAYRNQSGRSHFGMTGISTGRELNTGAPTNLFNTTLTSVPPYQPGWSTTVYPTPRMAVNLPSGNLSGLGMTLGRLGGSMFDLDLRLDVGESQGEVQVISRPKIVTLDNKKASIRQGLKYPYVVRNQEGQLSTELKDIDLLLEVTPRISFDGSINMEISIKRNAVDLSITNQLGDPGIASREVATEVIVKQGETSVIGGIIEETKEDNVKMVPGLGRLPVIGWLFKGTNVNKRKTELLIFISPQIVEPISLK